MGDASFRVDELRTSVVAAMYGGKHERMKRSGGVWLRA